MAREPKLKQTPSTVVYEALKRDITHFVFKPGDHVVEEALSARYGVSRTPVREALRRLEQEGLVVSRGASGRFIPYLDILAFEDTYRVRAAIERLAAVQASERAEDGAIIALRDSWDHAFRTDRSSPRSSYDYADERFHMGVADLSQNSFAIDSLSRINDRIRIIRLVDFSDPERIEITTREHNEILDAIAARHAKTAGHLMHAHVERSMANVRALVSRALERIYLSG